MRHFILAASALAVLAGAPASAQSYGGDPYGGGRYGDDLGGYGDDAPRRYREYREFRPGPDDETDREYLPRRYGRGWSRRAPLGQVCVTSRGTCDAQDVVPINTPCSCFIPGFGMKRGAVGY